MSVILHSVYASENIEMHFSLQWNRIKRFHLSYKSCPSSGFIILIKETKRKLRNKSF